MSKNPFGDMSDQNPYAAPCDNLSGGNSGNPLLIPGIILVVLSLGFLLLLVASLPVQIARIRLIDTSTSRGVGELAGNIVILTVLTVFTPCVVYGSIGMIRLKGYTAAKMAAIFAVIPYFSPCFVLGIPFGIWALIVLRRPEVKRRFS